jgi:hypothetical protein
LDPLEFLDSSFLTVLMVMVGDVIVLSDVMSAKSFKSDNDTWPDCKNLLLAEFTPRIRSYSIT